MAVLRVREIRSAPQGRACTVEPLNVSRNSSRNALKEKSMYHYRWVAGCCRGHWIATRPWGNFSPSRSEVTTVNHRVTLSPLLSLTSFVAIHKKNSLHELAVNRLPAAEDRNRHRKKGRGQDKRGLRSGGRPLFSLLLKWTKETKPATIGKRWRDSRAGLSNIRPGGQNRPGKDSNSAHWMALKKDGDFGL